VIIFFCLFSAVAGAGSAAGAGGLLAGAADAFTTLLLFGGANGPDFCAPCLGWGEIGAIEIFVGSVFGDLGVALPALAATAGLTAATPAGFGAAAPVFVEVVATGVLATAPAWALAGFATALLELAGLLAPGLLAGAELLTGFDGAGAALFVVCACPAFGLAALGADEEENVSLIF
jgi:hypothetical protein